MLSFMRLFCLLLVSVKLGEAFTAMPASSATVSRRTTVVAAVAVQRDMVTMMPATIIEKEQIKTGGGPAVLDRLTQERRRVDEPTKQRKSQGHEAWEVRIYNDGLNTREHVARSLVQVTGMSEMSAYQTMMQAHQNGMAVVGRWVYEVAEMYHEALRKNGIVCDIVPVEEE
mmetsp:Transcript_18297/g.34961  ORF Transcript_18297/g.34961 Transcript_18297/m.34961 type:complete len:171 (+) Transcript_18297:188-700(+)|eukprot:scaffold5535_cov180-Amphora_coffeaeformis.AAC.3